MNSSNGSRAIGRVARTRSVRRIAKNALLSVRAWCSRLPGRNSSSASTDMANGRDYRRGMVSQRGQADRGASRMRTNEEELRNLANENLENELRELLISGSGGVSSMIGESSLGLARV